MQTKKALRQRVMELEAEIKERRVELLAAKEEAEKEVARLNDELEAEKNFSKLLDREIQKLAGLVSAQVEDCMVGPWCSGCQHAASSYPELSYGNFGNRWWHREGTYIRYCKKHIHEICPEFEGI